jgi:DNA invertase Pin-like site-specific DNA recombinase
MSVYAYIRTAVTDRSHENIENQKSIIAKITAEKGTKLDQIFIDEGVSGHATDRPSFNAMIDTIKANKGQNNEIYVSDFSRISRNPNELLIWQNRLAKYNTIIVSDSTPNEQFLDMMQAAIESKKG